MKGYISLLRLRFMLLLQYRIAAFAGVCTQLLFGFVRVMVFISFYQSTSKAQPISYEGTITYIWLSQAFLGLLPWNGDSEIQAMIRTGNVAYELCRPVDIYNLWFSRAIAQRTAPTILRAIPIFIMALLLLPSKYAMGGPHSFTSALAWLISMLGALLLSCAITNVFNIVTLWTVAGDGITRLLPAVIMLFSGMIVPLPLFPQWMQGVLKYLPFSGIVDVPARFYAGHIQPSQIVTLFPIQIIWTILLILFGKWLLARKMKLIVVQGG